MTKNLNEHGEKIDDAAKSEVQGAIDAAKVLKDDATVEELKEQITALTNASMKIGQAIYGNAKPGEGAAQEPSKDSAKEAEYEEKK